MEEFLNIHTHTHDSGLITWAKVGTQDDCRTERLARDALWDGWCAVQGGGLPHTLKTGLKRRLQSLEKLF